jgi:hypothetical protein
MVDDDRTSTGTEPSGEAGEAFSLVANDTRMRILLELWEVDRPLPFSELRERVGMRDSGQFNYHLDKLVGRFVRKEPVDEADTDSEEGYVLQHAGVHVLGAVYSGALTEDVTAGPVPVDGTCFDCDGGLVASYEDEQGLVACSECDVEIMSFAVPPALIEGREDPRLPRLYDDWVRNEVDRFARGICSLCSGPVAPSLDPHPSPMWEEYENHAAVFECERCGFTMQTAVGSLYLSHPAVAAFHLDHGIDLSETPLWDLEWLFDRHVDVHGTDPPSLDVHVDLDDERLALDVDEDLRVVDTERTAR